MEFFYNSIIINQSPVIRKPEAARIPEIKHICPKTNSIVAVERIEHAGKDVYISKVYKKNKPKPIVTKLKREVVQLPSGQIWVRMKRDA